MIGPVFGGWAAYEQAVVDVDLGDRQITLGREGVVEGLPWVPASPVFVVTAYNPGGSVSTSQNEAAQRRLLQWVDARDMPWIDAVGRSRDSSWAEPSLALPGLSEAAAIAIGRQFGQDAIFRWDGRSLAVIPCRSDDA